MLLTGSETVMILVGKQDTQSNAASAIDVNLSFIVEIVFCLLQIYVIFHVISNILPLLPVPVSWGLPFLNKKKVTKQSKDFLATFH